MFKFSLRVYSLFSYLFTHMNFTRNLLDNVLSYTIVLSVIYSAKFLSVSEYLLILVFVFDVLLIYCMIRSTVDIDMLC